MSEQAERFIEMVAGLTAEGADGRAGLSAIVREIEAKYPGEIQRLAASLELQKLRCPPATTN
jgi:hypothetical protein